MYIELFLLDNLLMNLIILRLASALVSVRCGSFRATLFAAIGAVIAALGASRFALLLSPAAKLGLTALMSFALPASGVRGRLIALVASAVSAAAVGGAVILLSQALGGEMRLSAVYSGISLRAALYGGLFASFLPNAARRVLARRVEASQTVRLHIALKSGESIDCAALVDSGNLLFDPLSALPVIVLSAKRHAKAAEAADMPIPARTAAGECTLYAQKPRSVSVNGTPVDALIAFSKAGTALVPACLAGAQGCAVKKDRRNTENDEAA